MVRGNENSSFPVKTADHRQVRRVSAAVAVLGGIAILWLLAIDLRVAAHFREPALVEAYGPETESPDPSADFRKFSHTGGKHAQLPCLLCHQRNDSSTRPKFSGHLPCTGCHVQQFSDTTSGICSICHQNENGGTLKAFPGLRTFALRFDHARHTSGAARTSAGCVACHSTSSRVPSATIPSGARAHSNCFQCHTPQAKNSAGAGIGSCDTCHQSGTPQRISTWAPAFRVGFSHGKHTAQKGLNCTDCHSVRAGAMTGRQVSAPSPLQHHASARAMSCITCHNGKRAFGEDDFTSCRKCHQGAHFYF